MSKADLYRKYADALELCEKLGINSRQAIRFNGYYADNDNCPRFDNPSKSYLFPLAVIEGKPVFAGDVLYWISNRQSVIVVDGMNLTSEHLTFELPPKPRTFTMNGVEFDVPAKTRTSCNQDAVRIGEEWYLFKDSCEANDFITLLQILLNGDQDKL